MALKRVMAKLGNMRKAADFIVYPKSTDDTSKNLIIQSDSRICKFDVETGKGLLSANKRGAGFMHLHPVLGATVIDVPSDVIEAAKAATPKSGDEIGPGVRIL